MEPRVLQHDVRGQGNPIVLVPGGLTGWLSWIPHQERLSRQRQVIRVQPIHNQLGSAGHAGDPTYSAKTERESLSLTLEQLGIAAADFAGWSGGGRALIEFALAHPERVRTLTLVEPAAYWILQQLGEPDPVIEEINAFIHGLAGKPVAEDDLARFLRFAGFVQPGEDARRHPNWERWLSHRMALSWQSEEMDRSGRSVAELAAIACPVLLVKGTVTANWLKRVVDVLGERLPKSRILELPGDHACHIQSIDPFLEALDAHLGPAADAPGPSLGGAGTGGGSLGRGGHVEQALVDGIKLEYEVAGTGEAVVCIHGAFVADTFRPLLAEPSLTERYQLIGYHRRGYAGSSRTPGPISLARQAADCRALLRHLGVERAHVVGHSFGGCVALQLARDAPELVHSLALLEPALMVGTSAQSYRESLLRGPQRYREIGAAAVVDESLQARCPGYRALLDRALPGAFAQAVADAGTTLESDLAGLVDWHFGEADARRIVQPVLAVLGGASEALWSRFGETHRQLLMWFPTVEEFVLPGATHFLQVEDPRGMAEALATFYAHYPIPV